MNELTDILIRGWEDLMSVIWDLMSDWLFTVIVAATFVLALSIMTNKSAWGRDVTGLTAESPFSPYDEVDQWGYIYPKECRRNLSFLLPKVIIDETKSLNGWAKSGRFVGYFKPKTDAGLPIIFIDKDIRDPEIKKKIIHHELCHAYWYFKYGVAEWHP